MTFVTKDGGHGGLNLQKLGPNPERWGPLATAYCRVVIEIDQEVGGCCCAGFVANSIGYLKLVVLENLLDA